MKLNKRTTGLTNFIFGIKNTLSIGTINLDTSLEIIIFHIVQVNILFLLYFVDIDKLRAFFNNLINGVI